LCHLNFAGNLGETIMANISAELVKDLRDKTGAGFMDCKKALNETQGDFEKAIDLLRKKGIISAAKRKGRDASEGTIGSYIHQGGRIGVLLELKCETDFVARTDDFTSLQRDIAMHIAAIAPKYLKSDDIPAEDMKREKAIYSEQAKASGKPENIIEKIVDGRMKKFYAEVCLLDQAFIKDEDRTVQQVVDEAAGKLGENLQVGRFVRFELGEEAKAQSNGAA
jgi:elongation factor Ts